MRRIDQIRAMPVYEMADALMAAGADQNFDYCPSTEECTDLLDKNEEVPQEMCRKCLIEWLREDPHEEQKG